MTPLFFQELLLERDPSMAVCADAPLSLLLLLCSRASAMAVLRTGDERVKAMVELMGTIIGVEWKVHSSEHNRQNTIQKERKGNGETNDTGKRM